MCSLFRRALSATIATELLRSIRNPATLPSIIHPNGTIPSGDFLSANRSTLPSGSEPSSLSLPYPYRATPKHLRICCSFPTERFRHTYPSNACPYRAILPHEPTFRPATPPPPCRATPHTFSVNNDIVQRLIPTHRRRCSVSFALFFEGPQSFMPTCSIFSTYIPDHLSIPSVQIL